MISTGPYLNLLGAVLEHMHSESYRYESEEILFGKKLLRDQATLGLMLRSTMLWVQSMTA